MAPLARLPGSAVYTSPQLPRRFRRRGIAPHLRIPVGPRTGVDDPRRGLLQSFEKISVIHVTSDDFHIFMAGARHRIGHEAHRISQGFFRRFEPDDAAGDQLCFCKSLSVSVENLAAILGDGALRARLDNVEVGHSFHNLMFNRDRKSGRILEKLAPVKPLQIQLIGVYRTALLAPQIDPVQ